MLRIAFVGSTRAGKSSAINALTLQRSAPIGLGNTTKTVAEYSAKINGINCTLIDTPADYPLSKLPVVDVVLYVTEVGVIDDADWGKFRTYFAEFNKSKSVPVHIAILITKCDSCPTPVPTASTSKPPPNILIADGGPDQDNADSYYDPVIIDAINTATKKYSETCPIIPFNAFGRIAKYAMPYMAKVEGRKALSFGHINLNISQFYDSTATTAEFQGLRQIMSMTDTLTKDIEKYQAGTCCGSVAKCHCCDNMRSSNHYDYDYNVSKDYFVPKDGQHLTVNKLWGQNNGGVVFCLYCLEADDYSRNRNLKPTCTPKEKNYVSKFRCRSGYRACAFNIAHPCGQIASKLAELYDNKSAPKLLKMAIIQFALNGQSKFSKSPNYNPEYWNLMATHLTFDRIDLASFKPKTKDEAFRLLQFSRQKSIVEKIDLYCVALLLPAESLNSLRIKCINGETAIFIDRPIKNISDLKLVFNLIPTKRNNVPDIDQLFSDLGEKQTYSSEILAEMSAIVGRINVKSEHYDAFGLFAAI